jgi:hypothetical protein
VAGRCEHGNESDWQKTFQILKFCELVDEYMRMRALDSYGLQLQLIVGFYLNGDEHGARRGVNYVAKWRIFTYFGVVYLHLFRAGGLELV